jgi:hypothetical protein
MLWSWDSLQPPPRSTQYTTPQLPPTVMVVLLAPAPPNPAPHVSPSQTGTRPRAWGDRFPPTRPVVPHQAAITESPVAPADGSAAQPLASSAPAQDLATNPLRIDGLVLQNAVREVNQKSVRQLALQSSQIDIFDKPVVHPIALAAAEASEPRCPPAGLLRESQGLQGYALTRDRSGDCKSEREARVRARAVALLAQCGPCFAVGQCGQPTLQPFQNQISESIQAVALARHAQEAALSKANRDHYCTHLS